MWKNPVTACLESQFHADSRVCGILFRLIKSGSFYLNSKTLLINFAQVQSISEDSKILLKNGESVFCSRRSRKETQDAYFSYVFHNLRNDEAY